MAYSQSTPKSDEERPPEPHSHAAPSALLPTHIRSDSTAESTPRDAPHHNQAPRPEPDFDNSAPPFQADCNPPELQSCSISTRFGGSNTPQRPNAPRGALRGLRGLRELQKIGLRITPCTPRALHPTQPTQPTNPTQPGCALETAEDRAGQAPLRRRCGLADGPRPSTVPTPRWRPGRQTVQRLWHRPALPQLGRRTT